MLAYKSKISLEELLDQVPATKGRYQRLVGRLIYISHIRSNIAYIISVVSHFMHNPSEVHMNIGFRILWYMKSTLEKGLMFSKNNHANIIEYYDSNCDVKG
jgi:hypothetical protein